MFYRILNDACTLVFWNRQQTLRVCGAWVTVELTLSLILYVATDGRFELLWNWSNESNDSTHQTQIAEGLIWVLTLVSSASIAVAWHRFAFLGEEIPTIHLRFRKLELKYAIVSELIFVAAIALPWAVYVLDSLLTPKGTFSLIATGLLAVAAVASLIVTIPFALRLGLMLPAISIGHNIGVSHANRLGHGLAWPIFLACICMLLPFTIIELILDFLIGVIDGSLLPILQISAFTLSLAFKFASIVLLASVFAAGYRLATEIADAETGGVPSNLD
ncbi:hypothetical protein [Roseibium sp.]|uniref:hypothetical protein n=1 Tax=Roseibium sp. TaxID=1936156 RepID=UPI003A976F22